MPVAVVVALYLMRDPIGRAFRGKKDRRGIQKRRRMRMSKEKTMGKKSV